MMQSEMLGKSKGITLIIIIPVSKCLFFLLLQEGDSVLMGPAGRGFSIIVECLLQHNADPNITNKACIGMDIVLLCVLYLHIQLSPSQSIYKQTHLYWGL